MNHPLLVSLTALSAGVLFAPHAWAQISYSSQSRSVFVTSVSSGDAQVTAPDFAPFAATVSRATSSSTQTSTLGATGLSAYAYSRSSPASIMQQSSCNSHFEVQFTVAQLASLQICMDWQAASISLFDPSGINLVTGTSGAARYSLPALPGTYRLVADASTSSPQSGPLRESYLSIAISANSIVSDRHVIAGGGSSSIGSGLTLVGTIGQYNASTMSSAELLFTGGFWGGGTATPRCPADVDDGTGNGTPDGGVTIEDLLYYLALFGDGDARADLDDGSGTGTPDGGVTIEDLLYFALRYQGGC